MRRFWVAALAVAGLSACTDANGRKITFFSLLEQDPGLTGPSSLPPAGYSSDIWIDNRGCSFVRTGTDTVRWVPQVDSSRKPICDPSLAVDIAPAPQIQSPTTALPGVGTVIDPETGLKTEILPPKQIPPSYVQVGAFADRTNGIATRKRFTDMGFPVVGTENPPAGTAVNVVLGPFTVQSALDDAVMMAKSLGFSDAFTYQN